MVGLNDPYAELPELYDLEHASFADDIDLYLQFASVIGDPVLELGCGTGRVLVRLAEAGHRITGIDQSPTMLDRARAAITRKGVADHVFLHQASMLDAESAPGGPFGLVVFSLNGLMHLPEPGAQRTALRAARRALDPRGMLVIDLLNPSADLLATFDGRVLHEGAWEREDGTIVNRFSARTLSHSEQRIETELWYDIVGASGAFQRVRTRFPMRYLVRSEVELLLEVSGFVEWQIYGSYELDPYSDESERLIITAEVTPS